jgi:molybdopterin converting factor small subunit
MKIFVSVVGVEVKLKQETAIEPSSHALKDVLRILKDQDNCQLERFIDGDLSPIDCSVILVNGRNILSLNGQDTQIHDGDELTFMVPVAGG